MRPSPERVREVFQYDASTGLFNRLISRDPRYLGITRGSLDQTGYLRLCVDGKQWHSHRLAWVCHHRVWQPDGYEIDHINGDRTDNRIINLRLATRGQNATNSPAQKHNKVGLRGVHFHVGAGRYRAQIQKHGKMKSLGYFDTPEEAHAAYITAAQEMHGAFVRTLN